MVHVAVLVLNWNGQQWLERCLESVYAQKGITTEIHVVDNGSSDGSVEFVARRFPNVRVHAYEQNLGYAGAYNRAIRSVDAPFVFLLNNDTVVQPGCIDALYSASMRHPGAAVIGAKLLFLDRPGIINHAGGRLTVLGSAYDIGLGSEDGPEFDQGMDCGCVTGAAMLIRRDIFLAVGGFDPRYFAYFEDADLCWRIWLRGDSVRYEPTARILHAYGGSTGRQRNSLLRIELCQANRLRNMVRNLSTETLYRMLPASLAFDAYRIGEFARHGNITAARALLRGTRRFLKDLRVTLIKRREIQNARVRSDNDLLRLGIMADLNAAAVEWRRLSSIAPSA